MKKTLPVFFVLLAVIVSPLFAEPDWVREQKQKVGKVHAPPEAKAIILHQSADFEISSKPECKVKIRRAVLILKPAGKELAAITELISEGRQVKDLEGWLISKDGDEQKLKKEDIVEISSIEAKGYYDDNRFLFASFGNRVTPGSLVCFKYEIKDKDWTNLYQEFVLQTQEPVEFTRLTVELPKEWQLFYSERFMDGIEHRCDQSSNTHIWEGRDLPYRPDEPYMPSWQFLARAVRFSCSNPGKQTSNWFDNWQAVAKWGSDLFEKPARADISIARKANEITLGFDNPDDKISAVAQFARDNIRYVAVEIGKGRFQPRQASETLYNRYGDCKDKATLMRSFLKAIGIPSYPVLANATSYVDSRLPTPFQFDHCIIGIPVDALDAQGELAKTSIDGWLYFDPTSETTALGDLPPNLQGARVLRVSENDTALARIPYPTPKNYVTLYNADVSFDDFGKLNADVTVTYLHNRASLAASEQRDLSEKEITRQWETYFAEVLRETRVYDFRSESFKESMLISFKLEGSDYVQNIGDMRLLRANLFEHGDYPVLTAKERTHPIWFGPPSTIETNIALKLPQDYEVDIDNLPGNGSCETASIEYELRVQDEILRYHSTFAQQGKLHDAEDYESAKAFSRTLQDIIELPVVLKKRTN